MFYLENNWELNSEDECGVVHYVLHYSNVSPYDDNNVYTKDGSYVKVLFTNDEYVLQNEPCDNLAEVCEYLNKLNGGR